MVLIWLQLVACISHKPTHIKRANSTEFSVVLTAENIQQDETITLPNSVEKAISERLGTHSIKGNYIQELPVGYSSLQKAEKKAQLINSPNRLLIDFKTEYFSQIAGRFRWVVHATILLQESQQITVKEISVPVFHKFGHLKDAASIQSALPIVLDEVTFMINEHHVKEDVK